MRHAASALLLLLFTSCGGEEPVVAVAGFAGSLPAPSDFVLEWDHVEGGLFGDPSVAKSRGAMGTYRVGKKGPRQLVATIARDKGAALPRIPALPGHEIGSWRSEGGLDRLLPKSARSDEARLGAQAWFRASRQGLTLERGRGSFDIHVDLTRYLPDLIRETMGKKLQLVPRQLPGMQSFLSLGARVDKARRSAELFLKLARTPIGLAKAIDLENARLTLLPEILGRHPGAAFVIQRFEANSFIQGLLISAQGLMGSMAQGFDFFRVIGSAEFGLVFRREFWNAIGHEWAIVMPTNDLGTLDPGGNTRIYVSLRDRNEFLSILDELAGRRNARIFRLSKKAPALYDLRILGKKTALRVDKNFAVIGRHMREEPKGKAIPPKLLNHSLTLSGGGRIPGQLLEALFRMPVGRGVSKRQGLLVDSQLEYTIERVERGFRIRARW